MSRRAHVVLVPGFFGFANLGDLAYFGHVHAFLREAYAARGVDAVLHVVRTRPTASLPKRAARVLETLHEEATGDDASIHLVGHSSGGIDCRLLLDPRVTLPTAAAVEPIVARVTAAVSVAAPHRGTPVAAFFTTRMGGQLLGLLSLATTYALRFGQVPLKVLFAVAAAAVRPARGDRILDQLFQDLLADFTPERRAAIGRFIADMRDDRGLLTQLMPAAMATFDATAHERPSVRYGSVVTCAPVPRLSAFAAVGLDASGQVSHLLYRALRRLAADPTARLPPLGPAVVAILRAAYDALPDPSDNDGMVPTLSQIHGEVVCATRGDHLDVIGHFGDAARRPPHFDWLVSGSGFDRARFEAVWNAVADYLTGARPASAARSAESAP
jgi:triacylglycerol esterase/lipase EstA (alpha/beta hydrolase family)